MKVPFYCHHALTLVLGNFVEISFIPFAILSLNRYGGNDSGVISM
jgi:hypothetical protein